MRAEKRAAQRADFAHQRREVRIDDVVCCTSYVKNVRGQTMRTVDKKQYNQQHTYVQASNSDYFLLLLDLSSQIIIAFASTV